jgi:hypothetical protein
MARRINRARLGPFVAAAKDAATAPAAEVAARLYKAILALPEINLLDGSTAKVEAYYPPEVNDDGQQNCGIDVRLSNGDLLEFTLTNTGWEKSFVGDLHKPPIDRGRKR